MSNEIEQYIEKRGAERLAESTEAVDLQGGRDNAASLMRLVSSPEWKSGKVVSNKDACEMLGIDPRESSIPPQVLTSWDTPTGCDILADLKRANELAYQPITDVSREEVAQVLGRHSKRMYLPKPMQMEYITAKTPQQERRYKILRIKEDAVLDLFNGMRDCQFFHLPVTEKIPEGTTVEQVWNCQDRRCWMIRICHESFDPVPDGDLAPIMDEFLNFKMMQRRKEEWEAVP